MLTRITAWFLLLFAPALIAQNTATVRLPMTPERPLTYEKVMTMIQAEVGRNNQMHFTRYTELHGMMKELSEEMKAVSSCIAQSTGERSYKRWFLPFAIGCLTAAVGVVELMRILHI